MTIRSSLGVETGVLTLVASAARLIEHERQRVAESLRTIEHLACQMQEAARLAAEEMEKTP